ncbi:hypothetical protein BDZ88DRAFT_267648 [Geranomyces variabilis]|nr:hypothetical protein BDZ88DRAFT_267648 [Geranomyces variabilis]
MPSTLNNLLLLLFVLLCLQPPCMRGQPSPSSSVSTTPTPAVPPPPVTVTVTATASAPVASPSTCPVCFNCNQSGCKNFGTCDNGKCSCLAGFGGDDCSLPTCGSPNLPQSSRAVRTDPKATCCDDGFIGNTCNVCTRDDVCKVASPGISVGTKTVCNTDSVPWKKSYSMCDVQETLLTLAYPKDSRLTIERNIANGTAYGIMWYTGLEQFACQASSCVQTRTANQTTFSCPTLQCYCVPGALFCGGPGGGADLSGPINSAQGSLAFVCPRGNANATSACTIQFEFLDGLFPKGFKLVDCVHGECALNTDDPGDTDTALGVSRALGAVGVAAVAVAGGLVALLAACLGLACVQRARAKAMPVPAPRKGVQISIRNLAYSVGPKTILENIDGEIYAGRALAIMGPSGAGKSTLLDIVAGKTKRGNLEGAMLINGRTMSKGRYKRLVGFVDQDDILMETLTVRETLMFSAKMRLPESMAHAAKQARVQEVMDVLGLTHIADSRIGGVMTKRGISGGEKRRVSIGVELVTNPAVLYLDEPTSGLDSHNAHSVVRTITDLAHRSGKTIVFTIHQPRSDVYAMFDDVCVLTAGRVMYFGAADTMEQHFTAQGSPCPRSYNIADWVLDLAVAQDKRGTSAYDMQETAASGGASSWTVTPTQREDKKPGEYELRPRRATHRSAAPQLSPISATLAASPPPQRRRRPESLESVNYSSSPDLDVSPLTGSPRHGDSFLPLHKPQWEQHDADTPPLAYGDGEVDGGGETDSTDNGLSDDTTAIPSPSHRVGFLTQISALLDRGSKNLWRRPTLWCTHLAIALLLGSFVGGLYWHADSTLGGIQNRFGSIFFIMSLLGFSGLSAIGSLSLERDLFIRERANGVYSPAPFLLSRVLLDLIPLRIVPAVLMGTVAFFMVGYTASEDHFVRFLGVLCLFAANAGLLCMAVGTAVRDVGTANLVGSLVLLFQMLFSGFLLNQDQIPAALRWIQYLSLFRFAYEALVVNDIAGLTITDDVAGVGLTVPASIVLDKFGFDRSAFGRDVAVEGAYFVAYLVLIALLTYWKLRERR